MSGWKKEEEIDGVRYYETDPYIEAYPFPPETIYDVIEEGNLDDESRIGETCKILSYRYPLVIVGTTSRVLVEFEDGKREWYPSMCLKGVREILDPPR